MTTTIRRNRLVRLLAAGTVLLLVAGTAARADVLGQITKTSGQKIVGTIRWQPVSKQYAITPREQVVLKVAPREVADIRVKTPENLERAAQLARAGKYSAAIPALQNIVDEYTMLQWDVMAGQYLVTAYMKTNDPDSAARVGNKIVDNNPRAPYAKEFAPAYWEALVETEQFSRLRKMLDKAAEMGDRELAAIAQVRRGDMDRKRGDFEDALIDGYLRTAFFFQQIKSVQPEAIYKAAKCFEELGQHSHAEKMRKRLLVEFPNDPYTEKVKSGV